MQKRFKKYFWDGMDNAPAHIVIRRILEYADFPDILHIAFSDFKANIHKIGITNMRTDKRRIEWLQKIMPYTRNSNSWDEAIQKMLEPAFGNLHKMFDYENEKNNI